MNEAIKLAIEKGGWKPEYKGLVIYPDEYDGSYIGRLHYKVFSKRGDTIDKLTPAEITSDPLFWQALGKALGWAEEYVDFANNWRTNWHRYIDCLADNGDAEKFFKDLLTSHQ